MYSNSDPLLYLSPLQKARRALREALKKAAQDLFVQNSPKQLFNINFECEGIYLYYLKKNCGISSLAPPHFNL